MTEREECGHDHNQELREILPEFMMLENALNKAKEYDTDDLGHGIKKISEFIIDGTLDRVIEWAKLSDKPFQAAFSTYCADMIRVGFMMGVMTRHYYDDTFGTVEPPTFEEVEEKHQTIVREQQEERENAQKLFSALREAGIPIPDDLDPNDLKVVVGSMEELRAVMTGGGESASEETDQSPGMYL